MKVRLLACLMVCLLFVFGCEKESLNSANTKLESLGNFAKGNNNKVKICHKGDVMEEGNDLEVGSGALANHLSHGDVQLIDEDGDGYVTQENYCGIPVDCDDTDPLKNESCFTLCEEIASLFSQLNITPTYIASQVTDPINPNSCRHFFSTPNFGSLFSIYIVDDGVVSYWFPEGNFKDNNGNENCFPGTANSTCTNSNPLVTEDFRDSNHRDECLQYIRSL